MTSAGGIAKLEQLRDAAVAAVRQVAGVESILSFGSLAKGGADEYSDVDLEVIARDPQAVAPYVYASLGSIGDIDFVYPLSDEQPPDGVMVFFSHLGYFNKIDIGVSASLRFATGGSVELFKREAVAADQRGWMQDPPQYTVQDRQFTDAALTGIRAIKYLKRQQPLPASHLFRSLTKVVLDRFVALVLDEPRGGHAPELLRLSRADFPERDRIEALPHSPMNESTVVELMRLLQGTRSAAPGPSSAECELLQRVIAFAEGV